MDLESKCRELRRRIVEEKEFWVMQKLRHSKDECYLLAGDASSRISALSSVIAAIDNLGIAADE